VLVDDLKDSPVGRLVAVDVADARGVRERHQAFVPYPLPQTLLLSQRTYKLLSEADRALGRLDAIVQLLPNPQLLVRPSLTKEAVATSALEGTFAPLSDVLEADYVDDRRKTAEVREIQNYVRAAMRGLELIKDKPICLNLVAQLQQILVRGTRGDSYDAGRLRERLVAIGEQGRGIEHSRFVPPPHGDLLKHGVSDWEKWLNAEDDLPLLVKAALAHYQFETLHPFSDGNGRLGRLIITLQLMYAGVLHYPILNMSPWFEPRREVYIDHLLQISRTGDFDPWVAFFAEGVAARASAASQAIQDLLGVREEMLNELKAAGLKGMVLDLAGNLIGFPVLDVNDAVHLHDVSYPTANSAVGRLVQHGILRQVSRGNYARIFACDRVYQVIERA